MKITIPTHIKELLERIANEYEKQYTEKKKKHRKKKQNDEVYNIIKCSDGRVYVNEECDLYMVDSIRDFIAELDKQEAEIFQANDEYTIQKGIVFYIKNYLGELPINAYNNVYRDVYCDEELKKVIAKKKFQENGIKEEIKELKNFIENRKIASWEQYDAYVDSCIFKFVSTEQEFEKILSNEECEELTPGYKEKFAKIRIAFLEKTERDIYKEKGLLDEVEKFYYEHIQYNNIESDLETFDMWHNVKRTGVYYVFVPVK